MSAGLRGVVLDIEKLGQRGEGVARTDRGLVFVPYALPGDAVRAEGEGESGLLIRALIDL